MRAFVTGGSGFVGGTLIRMLRIQGHEVLALARSEKAMARVRSLGAEPLHGDLEQVETLFQSLRGCDVAFHAAAALDFGGSLLTQERINVDGTRHLLQAVQKAGISRLVAISAASILCRGVPLIDADETWPLPERFVGPYSRTKAAAEKLVLSANTSSFATMAIRPPGIWGAGDANILPQLTQMVRKGQFLWFDHGRYPYVTCHVENVCEGAILAAERGRGGEAYFVTDGPQIPFREFILGLLQTQGLMVGERSVPWRLALLLGGITERTWHLLRRPGSPPLTRETVALLGPLTVSDQKARRELGYQGKVSREQGLAAIRKLA